MAEINERVLIAIFTAVESAHAFSAFMPSTFTIRTFATEGNDVDEVNIKVGNLRAGYLPASLFSLALGGLASKLIKSPLPLFASFLTIIFMISMYELSISGRLSVPLIPMGGGGG